MSLKFNDIVSDPVSRAGKTGLSAAHYDAGSTVVPNVHVGFVTNGLDIGLPIEAHTNEI